VNYQKNFARLVIEILSGEKSGKKIGLMLNIAQKNALLRRLFPGEMAANQTL
tara:strand:+ start:688 stop:843 length:156 start_codon:yes stop_codon:yes gene_type:complete